MAAVVVLTRLSMSQIPCIDRIDLVLDPAALLDVLSLLILQLGLPLDRAVVLDMQGFLRRISVDGDQ